jgi:hypothetical protein
MCLLMSVRYGGVARGPFTLTCQAKYQYERSKKKKKGTDGSYTDPQDFLPARPYCVDGTTEHPGTSFLIGGLNEYHMADLISCSDADKPRRKEPLRARVHYIELDDTPDHLYQTIYSYVCSGLPVIAIVHPDRLQRTAHSRRRTDVWHAVVVIGVKGKPWEAGFSIVYHDPSNGAYREVAAADFRLATEEAGRRHPHSERPAASFVCITPSRITVALEFVLNSVFGENGSSAWLLTNPPDRWTARLIATEHVEDTFPSDLRPAKRTELRERFLAKAKLPSHVWAFECFHSRADALARRPDHCLYYTTRRKPYPGEILGLYYVLGNDVELQWVDELTAKP